MVCQVGINLKKIDFQGHLWSIPGPFLICCVLFMIVLRPLDTPLVLPLTAIGGVLACHIWKWRGVAFSSALLAAVMVYSLQSQPSQSWIWIITLSLSIASAFVVSVLCSEEAGRALDMLSKDSNHQKQTLAHLNERFQAVQNKLIAEQRTLNLQISQLQQELAGKEEKQRSNEQLIRLARDEITATFTQHEKLLQELSQARQKGAAMEVKLIELEELVNPETARLYGKCAVEALQSELCSVRNEVERLTWQLQANLTKEELSKQQTESLYNEINFLQKSKLEVETKCLEQINALELQIQDEKAQREKDEKARSEKYLLLQQKLAEFESLKEENQELLEKLTYQKECAASFWAEKEAVIEQLQQIKTKMEESADTTLNDKNYRRLEGLYQQLRQQFSEKSEVLSATRKELFTTQEKLSALEKEMEEAKLYEDSETSASLHRLIAAAESELALSEQQHGIEINRLHEVIDSLMAVGSGSGL